MRWTHFTPLALSATMMGCPTGGSPPLDIPEPAPEEVVEEPEPSPPPPAPEPEPLAPVGHRDVSLGGAGDFGYFRRQLDEGRVPVPGTFDAQGFFAEHAVALPDADCGEQVCAHSMLGVLDSLVDDTPCTLLQIGLNTPLAAEAHERPPLRLALAVDTSGSMIAESKLLFVRRGLHLLVDQLDDDDQLAIVAFGGGARTVFSLAPVEGRREELHAAIDELNAFGGSRLPEGLELAYQETIPGISGDGSQSRVILLSDGIEPGAPDDVLEMSRGYNAAGIGLTTVGLGASFEYSLMSDLAEQANGSFYFVEDVETVEEVFTRELDYFTVPVAYDVEIDVTVGDDYAAIGSWGSERFAFDDDGRLGSLRAPSVFLTRYGDDPLDDDVATGGTALLVELMPRDDDGSAVDVAQVAEVALTFREPGTERVVAQTHETVYPHAPWVTLNAGFFDDQLVQKSFLVFNLYWGIEQAIDQFHSGFDAGEAVAMVERVAAAARDFNDEVDDDDVTRDIALLERLIEVMERNGAEPPADMVVADDPWPAD